MLSLEEKRVDAQRADDWERHWSDYAEANRLNPAQDYRRRLIFDALDLANHDGDVRLLDLGSGQGEFAAEVHRRFPRVQILGLELSQEGIQVANRKVPSAVFLQQDLLKPLHLPTKYLGWATHAVCSEVLEHVEEPAQLLRNVLPCLAPGCKVVITVPGGPMSQFDRHIGHRRHFSEQAVRAVLSDAGLNVIQIARAGFPFFNLYRLVVIARGRSLIRDVCSSTGPSLSAPARLVMQLFSILFGFNAKQTKFGWQLLAVSRTRTGHQVEVAGEAMKHGEPP